MAMVLNLNMIEIMLLLFMREVQLNKFGINLTVSEKKVRLVEPCAIHNVCTQKLCCEHSSMKYNSRVKGTSHDPIFQFSLFSTLADIFAF